MAGRRRGYRSVRWAKRFVSFADLPEEAAFRRSYTHYDVGELQQLLDPELWPVVDQLVTEHAAVYNEGPADDQVNRMCYTDTRMFLTGLNLAYTDRASMAASTEVRVPYVDKEVAARRLRHPGQRQDRRPGAQGDPQAGGRAVASQGDRVPAQGAVQRAAAGLDPPRPADMVEDLVAGGTLVTSGLVDKQMVRTMIDDDRRGAADRSKEIWQLLTLEVWYRQQGQRLMKQVAQNYKSGELALLEVPVPAARPGGVVVRTRVLAHLDRHRDDEDQREQAVADRQGPRPP